MKKIAMLFSLALAFAACTTDYSPEADTNPDKVRLSFRAVMPATKTITGSGDLTLDHYQVFVFNQSGYLEANTDIITNITQGLPSLDLAPGLKDIWAVGNAQCDLYANYDIDTKSDFLALRMNLFDQPGATGLFYSAKIENRQVNEDYTVDLEFEHLPCKVVIDKIERNFYDTDLAQVPMLIKRIYLSNVAADCDFACTGNPVDWYNMKGELDEDGDFLCYTFPSSGYTLAQNATYNTSHTFYSFPNPYKTDYFGGEWRPRRTRLVVECTLNGETCYYPITLPNDASAALSRNTVYHITKLTLKRPGSPDPDNPGDEIDPYMEYSFEVIVRSWVNDEPYDEIFD